MLQVVKSSKPKRKSLQRTTTSASSRYQQKLDRTSSICFETLLGDFKRSIAPRRKTNQPVNPRHPSIKSTSGIPRSKILMVRSAVADVFRSRLLMLIASLITAKALSETVGLAMTSWRL
jgi:hypothetical protein